MRRPVSSSTSLPRRWGPPPPGTRVHVCLSGGVDSSVAACLLRDAGYDLAPLYMRNWDPLDEDAGSGGCEWEKDWADVERICRERLGGVKPELVDLSREYWSDVFQPALASWENGTTPNPDVACNREIKFSALPNRLLARDPAAWIATGHYAQLFPSRLDAADPALHRGAFLPKDQSYYLATSPLAAFRRTLFPLGHLTKAEVRTLAKKFGLHTAEKKESMGICFVGVRKQFKSFLDAYISPSPGVIEDASGRVVGTHDGLWRYTIGEGARLGGFKERMFVGAKDPERNAVVIVPADSPMLKCTKVITSDFRWISPQHSSIEMGTSGELQLYAQTRSLQASTACTVRQLPNAVLEVSFKTPVTGVAPGQAVVVYAGDWCLGGGTIASTVTLWDTQQYSLASSDIVSPVEVTRPPAMAS